MAGDSFLAPSTTPRPLTLLLGGTAVIGLLAAPGVLATVGDPELAMVGLGTAMASGGTAVVRYLTRDVRR